MKKKKKKLRQRAFFAQEKYAWNGRDWVVNL